MLQSSFLSNQEFCPNVSVVIQVNRLEGLGLTYALTVSSSDGCVLQNCPTMVSPGDNLNITLMDGVYYNATLVVSNDCGNDSTTVPIQPDGENRRILNHYVSILGQL